VQICDQILTSEPENLKAMLRKTQALRMLGRLDEAEDLAEKLASEPEGRALVIEIRKEKKERADLSESLWKGKLGGRVGVDRITRISVWERIRQVWIRFCCKKRQISSFTCFVDLFWNSNVFVCAIIEAKST
jgi:hypothetical protein